MEKESSTYLMRSAGRCFGVSWMSSGFRHDLQRRRETRGMEARPGISDGRSRYRNLSLRGRPSGTAEAGAGSTARVLKGPI